MNTIQRFTDPELVTAIKEPELLNQAILQIYQDHAGITRSYIIGKGGSQQDADDIFQETVVAFIDTVRKGKFRQESAIRTFLISISKNLWLNEIRRRERAGSREKAFETGRETESEGISALIGERELSRQLGEMLQTLGESCRKILSLFYYENLSMKEITARMHYENEQVVRNKKYKCLQQLTDKIKSDPKAAKQISELIKN